MKVLTPLLALLLCYTSRAQKKSYPDCRYSYFKGHKVSTSECWDAQKRWGRSTAYNVAGEVIYENEIRRIAGSSSVAYKYYQSGAVMQADWHSAPDAGIQWYNKTTYFSEDGRITQETENNYDHMLTPIAPFRPTVKEQPRKKDTPATASCAVIYSSEMWFINTTPYTVTVEVKRNYQPSEVYKVILKKGEKAKVGQLVLAEQFDDPTKFYSMTASTSKPGKALIILPSKAKPQQASKEVRRYFFDIRRII
jgi:hypothetical protein